MKALAYPLYCVWNDLLREPGETLAGWVGWQIEGFPFHSGLRLLITIAGEDFSPSPGECRFNDEITCATSLPCPAPLNVSGAMRC